MRFVCHSESCAGMRSAVASRARVRLRYMRIPMYAHPDKHAQAHTPLWHKHGRGPRPPTPRDAMMGSVRRTQINKATALEAIPSTRSSLFTLLSPLLIASDLLHSRHPTRMPSCDRAHLKPGPSRGRRRTGRRIRDCVNWPTDFCCLQPFAALV